MPDIWQSDESPIDSGTNNGRAVVFQALNVHIECGLQFNPGVPFRVEWVAIFNNETAAE